MTTKERFGRPEEEESDRNEIKVTDRRMFTADGALREGRDDDGGEPAAEAPRPEAPPRPQGPEERGFERRSLEEPEGVDFTMLLNAMAQQALICLGEIPIPGADGPEVHLEQARFQIDMLDLLRIKCRGNLTPEEENLLDRILYQLRMLYVSRSGQHQG